MTTPLLASSLVAFRDQLNARYPQRDKASDGWIGDVAHQARISDHNPDALGIVRALDIDEDLNGDPADTGPDAWAIAEGLRNSRDPRIKYVIYEGRLFSSYTSSTGAAPWTWRPYTGPNAHHKHIHLSILPGHSAAYDARSWDAFNIGHPTPSGTSGGTCTVNLRVLRESMVGGDVISLQTLLNTKAGQGVRVDGNFGPATKQAVEHVQRWFRLPVDGVCGAKTWPCLFL